MTSLPQAPMSSGNRKPSEWEGRSPGQFFNSLFVTCKKIMLCPSIFFKELQVPTQLGGVLLFGVLVRSVGALVLLGSQFFFRMLGPLLALGLDKDNRLEHIINMLSLPLVLGLAVVLLPILSFLGILTGTVFNHFILWIFGGAKKGLNATLAVVCYSSVPMLVMIVPLFGGIVASVWMMVLCVIGFKEMHEIPWWKSILTVILPTLCCCFAFMGAITAILVAFAPQIRTWMEGL